MGSNDLDSLIANLRSADVQTVITSLESINEAVTEVVRQIVGAFRDNPNRYFIAEGLNKFGSIIVSPLREVFATADEAEVKTLAATLLLQFDCRDGVPWLLEAITHENSYECLAARTLSSSGISEATDGIIARLRACRMDQVDLIVCLLDALERLDVRLPDDVQTRFAGEDSPWQVRAVLASYGDSTKQGLVP